MDQQQDKEDKEDKEQKAPGLLSVIQSTLAAAFGVQSNEKRKKDFAYGKPGQFIIAGIIFTILFVLVLIGIVSAVV